MYDIAIIGGGVIGCAIARFLSQYDANICLIEKSEDVCSGTSKANSAIVHAGFDAPEGSLKAKFNVRGNEMIHSLCHELGFPFIENGSLVVCTVDQDQADLEKLLERGKRNGVPNLEIIDRAKLLKMEPNIADDVVAALYAPTGGICCPFNMTYAFADNACENGVEFILNTEVIGINKSTEGFFNINVHKRYIDMPSGKVVESDASIEAKYIINAAGVYGDRINDLISHVKYHITPRRGEYMLLDTTAGNHVSHTIFQLPSKMGKGILVTPTVHGNLLVGPTALNIDDKEATNTTPEALEEIADKIGLSVANVPFRQVITSFSGLRAVEDGGEFIVKASEDVDNYFLAIGMCSPGLSSAPAVGEYVAQQVAIAMNLNKKSNWKPHREGPVRMVQLSLEDKASKIKENPLYGNIVCRCCSVSEGEIIDAMKAPVPATSLDAIKRRSGSQMGRCQGGFCSPKIYEIMQRELGCAPESVTKHGPGSNLTYGKKGKICDTI